MFWIDPKAFLRSAFSWLLDDELLPNFNDFYNSFYSVRHAVLDNAI